MKPSDSHSLRVYQPSGSGLIGFLIGFKGEFEMILDLLVLSGGWFIGIIPILIPCLSRHAHETWQYFSVLKLRPRFTGFLGLATPRGVFWAWPRFQGMHSAGEGLPGCQEIAQVRRFGAMRMGTPAMGFD